MAYLELLEVKIGEEAFGTLSRIGEIIRFIPDLSYLSNERRKTVSLAWTLPGNPGNQKLLDPDFAGNVATGGRLPPFFANLIPESSSLRRYLAQEGKCNPADDFAMLAACGSDLPGAIHVRPLKDPDASLVRQHAKGLQRLVIKTVPEAPPGGFGLAGAQLKAAMSAQENMRRCTLSAKHDDVPVIVKMHDPLRPSLVRAEYAAMELAREAGARVASTYLFDDDRLDFEGRPFPMTEGQALAVVRFDRGADGRVHCEDFAQMFARYAADKYSADTCAVQIMRTAGRLTVAQGPEAAEVLRRTVINVMLGNTDAHLKNWTFIYPDGVFPALSPAYDIVPVSFYREHAEFSIEREYQALSLQMLVAAAERAGIPTEQATSVITTTVSRALNLWPSRLKSLPAVTNGDIALSDWLERRLDSLKLVADAIAVRAEPAKKPDAGWGVDVPVFG